MAERVRQVLSPYVRRHADQPVDWWPWTEQAFDEAARRQVPVLVSIGYAACHSCHVMARESFDDPQIAAVLNEHFVCIKVDREERPDVDSAYLAAVQALTGRGGWPLTVFTTPQGEPFLGGTYFPPEPTTELPSFGQVIDGVRRGWAENMPAMLQAADEVTATVAAVARPGFPTTTPDEESLVAAVQTLAGTEDPVHGGFGDAPKFPSATTLDWLIRHAANGWPTAAQAAELAARTCMAMARSALYDQLGGGFARYSVDAGWALPHFEKMLYDNALLARVYLHLWRLNGDPRPARIAEETCDFLVDVLGTPEGGFGSSLDAETDGVEGRSYLWTPAELDGVLGKADGRWAADLLGVTTAGQVDAGNTLRLTRPVFGTDEEARWRDARARLLAARQERPQPHRDDKLVLAWNAMVVTALAETGALLDRPDLVARAQECARLLLRVHRDGQGDWVRVSLAGVGGDAPAVLADVAALAEALAVLRAVTGSAEHDAELLALADLIVTDFRDGEGGFVDVQPDREDPRLAAFGTVLDPTDAVTPSGPSAAARALLSAAALTGEEFYAEAARNGLAAAGSFGVRAPSFVSSGLAACEALLDGPARIVVVGGGPLADQLHRTALMSTLPGAVVVRCQPDEQPFGLPHPPLPGPDAGYVCRGQACEPAVTSVPELARQVRARC